MVAPHNGHSTRFTAMASPCVVLVDTDDQVRTIRAVNPIGYCFSFLTFSLPTVALGSLLAEMSFASFGMVILTVLARILLHLRTRPRDSRFAHAFLLPLRDLLSLGLWSWSLVTRRCSGAMPISTSQGMDQCGSSRMYKRACPT